VFGLLHLNSAHRLIAMQDLFRDTLNRCSVYAREVVRSVLHHNSACVVLYHNHPSGNAQPTNADPEITDRIRAALRLIDVTVLDHLIVGDRVFSFQRAKIL
jgi:DNA repair protein RadC